MLRHDFLPLGGLYEYVIILRDLVKLLAQWKQLQLTHEITWRFFNGLLIISRKLFSIAVTYGYQIISPQPSSKSRFSFSYEIYLARQNRPLFWRDCFVAYSTHSSLVKTCPTLHTDFIN